MHELADWFHRYPLPSYAVLFIAVFALARATRFVVDKLRKPRQPPPM